jgi:hypothetical protein
MDHQTTTAGSQTSPFLSVVLSLACPQCNFQMNIKEPHLYVYRHFATRMFTRFDSLTLEHVSNKETLEVKTLARS